MGYDVYGHRPKSEQGRYFGITVSRWPSIWALMALVNSNQDNGLIDPKTLRLMASNNGAGLPGEQASALAEAMEAAIDDEKETARWFALAESADNPVNVWVNNVVHQIEGAIERSLIPTQDSRIDIEAEIEIARSFCGFLRNSGGFSVD